MSDRETEDIFNKVFRDVEIFMYVLTVFIIFIILALVVLCSWWDNSEIIEIEDVHFEYENVFLSNEATYHYAILTEEGEKVGNFSKNGKKFTKDELTERYKFMSVELKKYDLQVLNNIPEISGITNERYISEKKDDILFNIDVSNRILEKIVGKTLAVYLQSLIICIILFVLIWLIYKGKKIVEEIKYYVSNKELTE